MLRRLRLGYYIAKNVLIPGAPILIYHRICDPSCDPQLLSVSPQHFADQLEVLQRSRHAVRLRELEQGLGYSKKREEVFSITFDDGYFDNLGNAKALLERFNVPATVFIIGKNIGNKQEPWWDELDRIILNSETLPEKIGLEISGKWYSWDLNNAETNGCKEVEASRRWNISDKKDASCRTVLYRSLCSLLRPLPSREIDDVLTNLRAQIQHAPVGQTSYRILAPEEIVRLTQGGLIEVGGHTMTHPVLSGLTREDQLKEIQDNKKLLENILGHEISGFAYPYGTLFAFTRETVTLVQECGYKYACSNYPDLVRKGSNPYKLPRLIVRDWDGDEFARCLRNKYGVLV